VELFEAIRRSMSTGPGRSREYPGSWGSSADGSASPGKCDSAGAEAASTKPSSLGGDGVHRRILIADEQAPKKQRTRHGGYGSGLAGTPAGECREPRYRYVRRRKQNWAGAAETFIPRSTTGERKPSGLVRGDG